MRAAATSETSPDLAGACALLALRVRTLAERPAVPTAAGCAAVAVAVVGLGLKADELPRARCSLERLELERDQHVLPTLVIRFHRRHQVGCRRRSRPPNLRNQIGPFRVTPDMRTAALVGLVCALGGLAASAALGQVPLPPLPPCRPVTAPTVTVPPVTLPTPPVPAPPVPAPPPTGADRPGAAGRRPPGVTTPPVQVSAPPGGSGPGRRFRRSAHGDVPGHGHVARHCATGSSSGASAPLVAAASGAPRGRSTRSWIAVHGAGKRRTATLMFELHRKDGVRLTVLQVSPVCRVAARFHVGGHAGMNRVGIGGGAHGT